MSPIDMAMYAAAGAVLGALYFALLAWTVRLLVGQAAMAGAVGVGLARLALAGAAFWAIAQQGALPLLLALLGFVGARLVMLYRTPGG